jgi:hypothetical protein
MAKELSGKKWVARFPDKRTTDALADAFRPGCEAFIAGMRKGGATVSVNSTFRPDERAYLMFFAFKIANGFNPAKAEVHPNVEIEWVHRKANGSVDSAASKRAAKEMVEAYDIAFAPARHSRHTQGKAIDMTISWKGDLKIDNKSGMTTTISSTPRNGFNLALRKVGKTYKVTKHPTDPPHWSTDGR